MKPVTTSDKIAVVVGGYFMVICLGYLRDVKSFHVGCGWPFVYGFVPTGCSAFYAWQNGGINAFPFLVDLMIALFSGLTLLAVLRIRTRWRKNYSTIQPSSY